MSDEKSKDAFDPAAWLENLRLPNMDLGQMTEAAREDFRALQEANQVTLEGWQSLAQRQAELFQEAASRWQERMTNAMSGTGGENLEQQSEFMRSELEAALSNMRELAELAAKSQSDAMDIIRERFEEDMKTFFGRED